MKRAILAAAVVIAGSPILGLASGAMAAETEQVFEFYCAQCHGLEGKGDGPNVSKDFPVSPRNFTSAEEMNKLS
ncbi:MAG TPA: c-type cytochrome, partial [Afifellaceae bacterium]|nr:c-type cytochrome [Afifellaceae bacterium]